MHGGLRYSLAATSGATGVPDRDATGVPDRDAVFEIHMIFMFV